MLRNLAVALYLSCGCVLAEDAKSGIRWIVQFFNMDSDGVAKLNGVPVTMARSGDDVSTDITALLRQGDNLLEFSFSSRRQGHAAWGYRVLLDGHTVFHSECGFAGKAACPSAPSPFTAIPPNGWVIHLASFKFVHWQIADTQVSASSRPWAGAAAALLSWRERRRISPERVARTRDLASFLELHQLRRLDLALSRDSVLDTIRNRGPIWILPNDQVLYAVSGDGSEVNTYVAMMKAGKARAASLRELKAIEPIVCVVAK